MRRILFQHELFLRVGQGCGNGVARLVEQLADDRAFLFAERFHPLAPFGDAAAFAEIFYADAFERFLVARSFNLAQRVGRAVVQRRRDILGELLKRHIVKREIEYRCNISISIYAAFFFDFALSSNALFA